LRRVLDPAPSRLDPDDHRELPDARRGLSARGLTGPEAAVETSEPAGTPRHRWIIWLLKLAAVFALSTLILAAVARIRETELVDRGTPILLSDWLDFLARPLTITTSGATYFDPRSLPKPSRTRRDRLDQRPLRALPAGEAPELRCPIRPDRYRPTLLGRFLGPGFALTGVMLTLLPAFFLAGMAVFHLAFKRPIPEPRSIAPGSASSSSQDVTTRRRIPGLEPLWVVDPLEGSDHHAG